MTESRLRVSECAAGWSGDSFIRANNKVQQLSIRKTVWETPKDAQKFYDAMKLMWECPLTPETGADYVLYKTPEHAVDYLKIKDKTVTVFAGIPQNVSDKVIKTVLGE